MTSESLLSEGFARLIDNTVRFALNVSGGVVDDSLSTALESTSKNTDTETETETDTDAVSTYTSDVHQLEESSQSIVDQANLLTDEFDKTGDIRHSDEAISMLESLLNSTPDDDRDRHHILLALALALTRRTEIRLTNENAPKILLDIHLALSRSVFLFRQAVNVSPPAFSVKVKYLGHLGHTATLWSTALSSQWPVDEVLALLEHLKAEKNTDDNNATEKITGFVSAVIMASTLSTAFGSTQDPTYRSEGREMYRHTLRSMRDIIPLDTIIADSGSNMNFIQQISALSFMKDTIIPFILQVMALLMQSLVEVPLSAVIGRRAAALAMSHGFYKEGVEWLEQCLMLVWGQLNLRAPAPLGSIGAHTELVEGGMGQIVHAFLGLCVYVDAGGDSSASIAHPEQLAYFLLTEWLKQRNEALNNPIFKDLFKERPFEHILNAARTAPVVMLNLWESKCDVLVLYGEGKSECFPLEGVTEQFASMLQSKFREGLQSGHFRARGDEVLDQYRGSAPASKSSTIHRVLAALWNKVVKPIFDRMNLKPIEDGELDPPRLTWCPTGPTSFFPLHAAGLYGNSFESGTKTYEYVASSYTPTLTILADANVALCREPGPFKGVLAVSQPAMDGQRPIPNTISEVEALIAAVEAVNIVDDNAIVQSTWLKDASATKELVLSGMKSSTWVHLACHARQYPLNTSESAFMLANGETLSLADISAEGAADGELAFLSACQTAAGDFDLSEEGVHLAAGMLVAGYRSVIAATWSVRDQDAPIVADAVYRRLLAGGKIDRGGSALALHHATRLLRKKVGEDEVMLWAPFIHLGI